MKLIKKIFAASCLLFAMLFTADLVASKIHSNKNKSQKPSKPKKPKEKQKSQAKKPKEEAPQIQEFKVQSKKAKEEEIKTDEPKIEEKPKPIKEEKKEELVKAIAVDTPVYAEPYKISASQLIEILIDIKINSFETLFEYWKAIEFHDPITVAKISDANINEFDKVFVEILKNYGLTPSTLDELRKKYADNAEVNLILKELGTYRDEIKDHKCSSIFKKYFDDKTFMKVYSLFIYKQWQVYYAEYRELISKKQPNAENKIEITKEDIVRIIRKEAAMNIANKTLTKLNIPISLGPGENHELTIHGTFYYLILNDPINGNQLIFYEEINKLIFPLMQRGEVFDELSVDPMTLDEPDIIAKFNTLVNKIKKYRDSINSYLMALDKAKMAEEQDNS